MKSINQILEEIYIRYFDTDLLEMANLQPDQTGLKPIIFVSSKGRAKHGPRVKVSNVPGRFHPDDHFTVTAEHEPRVIGNCKLKSHHLADIVDWVKKNHDHIHHVWHKGDEMTASNIESGFSKL